MKTIIRLLSLFAFVLCLVDQAAAHEAKVIKLTGTAEVMLAGATAATPLALNSVIPEGAIVTTGVGAELTLETLPGVISTIQAGSTVLMEKLAIVKNGEVVTEQTATLDLKQGNIVSTLDPAKKSINRYGVRTPKGVAAARGTVYSVKVNLTGSTVATLSGIVTVTLASGVILNIPVGTASANGEAVTALAAMIKADPSLANDIAEAVKTVASSVQSGASAVSSPESATAVLAAVVNAASAALPAQAATFAERAIIAVTTSTNAAVKSVAAATAAAVTEAAVQGAVKGTPAANTTTAQQLAQDITNAAVTTAAANGVATQGLQGIVNSAAVGAAAGATAVGAPPPQITAPSGSNLTAPPTAPAPSQPIVIPVNPVIISPN